MGQSEQVNDLLRGLRSLAADSYPRVCSYCGKRYETQEQFLSETQGTCTSASGLMESIDDDDQPIIEAYRNCTCGSTLVEFFSDRRADSETAIRRRKRFGELLETLVGMGIERETARKELLAVVHGNRSELLESLNKNIDKI